MTFKAQPNRFLFEQSPTARATCRHCKKRIALHAPRLRIVAFVQPGRTTAFFRHATAHCITPTLARAVLAAHQDDPTLVPCATTMDDAEAAQARAALGVAKEG